MHQAANFLHQLAGQTPASQLPPMAAPAAQTLRQALLTDAMGYSYSGVVSAGDATQAIQRALYSWATVKLYYSAFYLARAMLALDGTAIFYMGKTPYSWRAVAGTTPVKLAGTTHKAALSVFESTFPTNTMATQQVAGKGALDWLMHCRENVNYGSPRFTEPDPPKHFARIADIGVRRAISAYLKDTQSLYAFDPDHAMLAMPFEALKQFLSMARAANVKAIKDADSPYLQTIFSDDKGPLAEVANLFRGL
ncbi:hypothetical protein EDF74_3330 [Stenotrophomonas rhizophila]|uniref:hypothetical protein n=1 Tax=Stenotrophomonas rhizophila TaxID=216778 RepID=UPI000F4C9FFD|nr:hypothetical protein [Stenotrophomonas rhizophila]ROP73894.1 hypothetical protein EDF74_3330 [Stenotrophomonas rhizophila]